MVLCENNRAYRSCTLFAHINPQALHRVLGPAGPRRIAGVEASPIPQCWHLRKLLQNNRKSDTIQEWEGGGGEQIEYCRITAGVIYTGNSKQK